MKHSDLNISRWAAALMWGLPVLLAIPNVALAIMGGMAPWAAAANILLPAGIYLLLLAAWRRTGLTALLMLPLMVLAAFQIVLLFLYADGSIIGVDMFLNVATTNSSEALELLGNLLPAIATVLVLYLPAIVVGLLCLLRRYEPSASQRRAGRLTGMAMTIAGFVALIVSAITLPHYKIDEDLYPLNVICNCGSAFHRAHASARYAEESAGFRYGTVRERPDSLREVYIAVIGETSRADNWQLMGYERFTTPLLCELGPEEIAACPRAFSESNTTHKSVPLLLSTLTARDFSDSINSSRSVISAFKEAGFRADFISMQGRNNSYIDFFGQEADTTIFLHEPVPGMIVEGLYDTAVLPVVDSVLARGEKRQLIVVHLYGSHFNYSDRYPRDQAYFLPDLTNEANRRTRGRLLNAYDNSIRQTDIVLSELIRKLDSTECVGGLIYTSDHGEDIFDDERGRFLHASPTPTFMQLHVPMLIHFTPRLRALDPARWHAAKVNSAMRVSTSASYTPTLLDMAGLHTPRLDPRLALTSNYFSPVSAPVFLNDRNRPENLEAAGFKTEDFRRLGDLLK